MGQSAFRYRATLGTGLCIVGVQEALRRLSPPSPSVGEQARGGDAEEDEGRRLGCRSCSNRIQKTDDLLLKRRDGRVVVPYPCCFS